MRRFAQTQKGWIMPLNKNRGDAKREDKNRSEDEDEKTVVETKIQTSDLPRHS